MMNIGSSSNATPTSTSQYQLGKVSVSEDGRVVNLSVGPDPLFAQSTFTLIIYLAGSFLHGLKGVQRNNDRDIEVCNVIVADFSDSSQCFS